MNEFTIEDKGITRFLHRLAKFGGWKYRNVITDEPNDFCYWTRRVLVGTIILLFVLSLVGLMWFGTAAGVYKEHLAAKDWAQWVKYLVAVLIPPGVLVGIVGSLLGFMFGIAWAADKWIMPWRSARQKRLREKYEAKQADPNLRTGWDAFKHKYCIRMNVPRRHR